MAVEPDPAIMTIVRKYLQTLRDNNYQFESAWLFGSYANNSFTEDSDIDIALVMDGVEVKFFKELELTKLRRNIDLRIEPHILNKSDLDMPTAREIITTGVKVA